VKSCPPAGIGLGTFPFAGPFTPVSEATTTSIVDRFFTCGGRHIETAPTYGYGEVERFLGRYLAGRPRASFTIGTSCGYVPDGPDYRISGAPEDIFRSVEQSLIRLNVSQLDVCVSHVSDHATPKAATARALCRLREQGMVRAVGVSNVDTADLLEYLRGGDLDVVQKRFSFINRSLDEGFASVCQKNGISITIYQVIERGLLTRRGPTGLAGREGDLRHRKPEFRSDRHEIVRGLLTRWLEPVAQEAGMPLETVCILWALHQPQVAIALVGATSVDQVAALPLEVTHLPDSLLAKLAEAYKAMSDDVRLLGSTDLRQFLELDKPTHGSATGRS
jgi:aryl-alcohol dehydrogenase-like predicted oxidoreductase